MLSVRKGFNLGHFQERCIDLDTNTPSHFSESSQVLMCGHMLDEPAFYKI